MSDAATVSKRVRGLIARAAELEAERDALRLRALRHALRYRRRARLAAAWKEVAKRARHIAVMERNARIERAQRDDERIARLADRIFELNTRVATLEAAVDRTLDDSAAGCNDSRAALREARDEVAQSIS